MASIVNAFGSVFNTALQTGLTYKYYHDHDKLEHGDDSDRIHPHSDLRPHDSVEFEGVTYDPVAKIVNEKFPGATEEEKTEYYNAIKSGLDSAQIFLQHCKDQDIQLRILQLNANGTVQSETLSDGQIVPLRSAVYFNTLSEFYEKGKDLYKQATNVKFIGSIVQIRNTSGDNGNSLDVSIAMKTSNQTNLTDADEYDGSGSNISVYNKQSFTKFLPASRYAYKTESLQKILSSYTSNPDWAEKKDEIYEKLAELLNVDKDDIAKAGNTLRCISGNDKLDYEGILDFKAFKERCCGIDVDLQYPGTVATLFDTYLKLTTVCGTTPYVFTIYGLFLLDKTVNDNINADLDAGEGEPDAEEVENKYVLTPITEEEVDQIAEDVLGDSPFAKSRSLKIKAKTFRRMNIPIVTSAGKFVKEYKPGMKLEKGEKIIKKTSVTIKPK